MLDPPARGFQAPCFPGSPGENVSFHFTTEQPLPPGFPAVRPDWAGWVQGLPLQPGQEDGSGPGACRCLQLPPAVPLLGARRLCGGQARQGGLCCPVPGFAGPWHLQDTLLCRSRIAHQNKACVWSLGSGRGSFRPRLSQVQDGAGPRWDPGPCGWLWGWRGGRQAALGRTVWETRPVKLQPALLQARSFLGLFLHPLSLASNS